MTDHPNSNGSRPTRAVVLWAFGAVLVVLVLATAAFLSMLANNHRSDLEAACRARISNKAAAIRDDRDSLGWDSLATSVLDRQPVDNQARARQIRDLDQRLADASALRSRSNDVCSQNPDFTP